MVDRAPYSATVFVDADNTLWETDQVFADAQLALLGGVEALLGLPAIGDNRLVYVRAVDQALAERHHSGLRYPPRLLAQALAARLSGEAEGSAIRRVLRQVDAGIIEPEAAAALEQAFVSALKAPPKLRAGVKVGLDRLRAAGCLVLVVTEGARQRIDRTVKDLGLASTINRVIEAPKQTRLYHRVAKLSDAPWPMFMVGDQLQRDIAPAKAAGLMTIYFPGGFQPRWEPAEDAVGPDHRISSFDEVPGLVAARLRETGATT